jgi:hypothetical protein
MMSYQSILLRQVNSLCDNIEEAACSENGALIDMAIQSELNAG